MLYTQGPTIQTGETTQYTQQYQYQYQLPTTTQTTTTTTNYTTTAIPTYGATATTYTTGVPTTGPRLLVFLQLDQDQSLYLNYIDKDLEYLQMNKMVLYQLL